MKNMEIHTLCWNKLNNIFRLFFLLNILKYQVANGINQLKINKGMRLMKKTFYVFRHGETELNAKKVWQGTYSNPDLNERGREQAAELGQKLALCGIEKIYSSPFLRAKYTAEIVNKFLQVPLELEDAFHECCFGDAEGHTMDEIDAKWPQLMHDVLYPTPTTWDSKYPGDESESKHQVFDRVNTALLQIARTCPCKVIGISTHGGVMSSLLAGLKSYGLGLPNCCVAQIEYNLSTDELAFIKMI